MDMVSRSRIEPRSFQSFGDFDVAVSAQFTEGVHLAFQSIQDAFQFPGVLSYVKTTNPLRL